MTGLPKGRLSQSLTCYDEILRAEPTKYRGSIRMRSQRAAFLLLTGISLSACGGGSSSSDPPPPPPTNQSAGGIWTTQSTVTSGPNAGDMIKSIAIASENGDFYFAARNQTNGCTEVGFGQASVTGSSISGNLDVAIATLATGPGINTGCTYPDGSTSGTGTFSGTITQRSSMTLTDTATTSMGMALGSETDTWTFSNAYLTPSSLATIAGNYTDGTNTLSIDGNGVIFEQDPTTGCVLNGQVTLINTQYNAYSLSVTVSSCMGTTAAANGVTFSGLAALDQTVSPAQLDFGLSASVNGQFVVLVDEVTKQ